MTGRRRGRFERRHLPLADGDAPRASSYRAFVPAPVRELRLRLHAKTAAHVAAADEAVRALNAGATPSEPASLDGLGEQLLRAEALASSAIENLALSHKRLAHAALQPEIDRKATEILTNIDAMEAAIELGRGRAPIRVGDIQAIHATLARGTALDPWAGRLREGPGWIHGSTPADAKYVPPPAEYLDDLLADLLAFINQRSDLPATAHAAVAHAQFEAIHPFADGNGRVGRCLIHAMAMRRGLAPRYLAPISVVLTTRRERYLDGLTLYRRGDIKGWCSFFASATLAAARKAAWFTSEVGRLQDDWRTAVSARSDAAVWPLIDALPSHPVIDARTAEALSGRSFQSANTALEMLERAGVLVRRDNRMRGRSWEAPALLALLEDFDAHLSRDEDDFAAEDRD
ncbi:MAG: Fic family protein [Solirubrobacteraceae bacterium]|jgi:Fic family protein